MRISRGKGKGSDTGSRIRSKRQLTAATVQRAPNNDLIYIACSNTQTGLFCKGVRPKCQLAVRVKRGRANQIDRSCADAATSHWSPSIRESIWGKAREREVGQNGCEW